MSAEWENRVHTADFPFGFFYLPFLILLVFGASSCQRHGMSDEGRLPGLFSVGLNDDGTSHQVYFSQGNLQWSATGGTGSPTTHRVKGIGRADGTWRFAPHQYDVVGNANSRISSTDTGWIDLFGWGTSGYDGKHPYLSDTCLAVYLDAFEDISGTQYDWGVYNAISNGGRRPNCWRTLTDEEWTYLAWERADADSKSGVGRICLSDTTFIDGFIFLPDVWICPAGVVFVPDDLYQDGRNTYTPSQWALMEAAGAIFLPAAGNREGKTVYGVGSDFSYWTSFCSGDRIAWTVTSPYSFNAVNYYFEGHPVRLCQDCQ